MKLTTRIMFTLVLVVICFLCLYFSLAFITDFTKLTVNIVALTTALIIGVLMMVISHKVNKAYMRQVIKTTLIISAFGFFIGFIGPLIFTPDDNLGPLLGIFVTGPLSFVIGLVTSAIYFKSRIRISV